LFTLLVFDFLNLSYNAVEDYAMLYYCLVESEIMEDLKHLT